MKTTTFPNMSGRSIHLNLDRNNLSGVKITSKGKIKIPLAMAALVALLMPACAAEISLETAPPVVVKTVPVAGATDVDTALTEVKVTYSKAMQDGSWSWSTWGEENYPETAGKPHYLSDARTCVLPVKLQPNKFYAIWLNSDKFKNFTDKAGRSAVPYLLTFSTRAVGGSAAVSERELNKAVSEFPAGEDLSTPEGACVAWQRANARKDAPAVSRLSLVPIDAREQENWYRLEEQRDAEDLAIYLKALADSKVIFVQTWRGELADVITFLPFTEGKGRHPYSSRSFGLVNGTWKNLGEERWPDLASAKTGFARKKEAIWQQFQNLKSKGPTTMTTAAASDGLLNEDQRAVLAWTDRQFRGFFDNRTFEGWSDSERTDLETKCVDAVKGPRSSEYYRAINTLAALRSTKGLPVLRGIAYERVDRNNRDRWMAIRALGLIGDKADVPELIHLVYHGNVNTRWWAQISLVRITGQNFGKDWNTWGKWWNDQKGEPSYQPEIIRWWDGQPEPDKLVQSLDESDAKFLADLRGKSASIQQSSSIDLAAKLNAAEPTMNGIREHWTATVNALDSGDNAAALAAARRLAPQIQDFLEEFRGTSLEAGSAKALDLIKTLTVALAQEDQNSVQTTRVAMATLGQSMEEQIKAIVESSSAEGDRPQTGRQYIEEQMKQAQAGNYWAKFRLWEAYSKGARGVERNSAEADKWVAELVKGAYLARFEPGNEFNPKTPEEMLKRFSERCRLFSSKESLGGASFFRTTKRGDRLVGSFLTEFPDEFKKAVGQHSDFKLISIEKLTPEMFKTHEASRQESL